SNPERADDVKKNSPVDCFLVGCREDGHHEHCGVVVERVRFALQIFIPFSVPIKPFTFQVGGLIYMWGFEP
ncbi:MAG: hypothetical protein J6Q76_04275, partial [Clostridia bacterium]|nr:hypothetical protein [Clostridia bacterium]